jgi:hypothetical protein
MIMSISALGSNFSNNPISSTWNYRLQNAPFEQLGQDLTSGNLAAAQSDFANMQQAFSQITGGSPSTASSNPVAQAFLQLSTDLKSGNLSAAKQDYANIQQDMNARNNWREQSHRITAGGNTNQTSVMQELNQLGQELSAGQLGNVGTAQQTYASLIQSIGSTDSTGISTALQAIEPDSLSLMA